MFIPTKQQREALDLMNKWWINGEKRVFELAGYAGCVDKDTLILTNKGNVSLEDLIKLQYNDLNFLGFKDFNQDIKVFNGKKFTDISQVYATNIMDGYSIETNSGLKLKCSNIHPLYVENKGWIKAKSLKLGDKVLTLDNGFIWKYEEILVKDSIKQKFYDITVPDGSSFISNAILSHNTGKSTLVKQFIEDIGISEDNVKYATFTGKAALVLQQKGLPATTIHQLIYIPEVYSVNKINKDGEIELDKDDKPVKITKIKFTKRETLPDDLHLIVLDECSMISKEMWKDLLHYDKPIIVLGDPGQIPPIHGSSPLLINPDVKLTEVVRQASDSPILKLAMMAREGKVIPVGKYGHGVHVIYEDRLSDNLLMWADIILCGKNSTRDKINNYIRFELLNRKSDLPEKGDKIICRKNCWDISLPNEGTPLINGMIGFVENHIDKETISNKTFILDFKPEFSKNNFFNNLTVNRTMFEGTEEERKKVTVFSEGIKFEYGYAITTHLSQGSEWENVIIIEEFLGDYNYMKKWLYTAITRASKKLVIVRKRPKTYY